MKTGCLLAPLAKIELVRKRGCVGGFDHESNVSRWFKMIC